MKILSHLKSKLPKPTNAVLAVLSAILLILAFPGFEFWFIAWFALVPLFWAIEREKESWITSLILGWIFGTIFFFGTTWWLTFAPITYAKIPAVISYFLLFCAVTVVGFFPGVFCALFSILLKRFDVYAILSAPFLWATIEFLRFWLTGNNWNAVGYSHAFKTSYLFFASFGGVYLISFFILLANAAITIYITRKINSRKLWHFDDWLVFVLLFIAIFLPLFFSPKNAIQSSNTNRVNIIGVQPNVPMSGLDLKKWKYLRQRHIELAESALQKLENERQRTNDKEQKTIVIFPESPMNFMYARDREFQEFIGRFATKNNVSVLFNSAEPVADGNQFYNSAVMVNERGEKIVQYDKIHLMPFGEYLPLSELLGLIMPPLVGNFAFGEEYDLIPLGKAQAGIMICFESHFPGLSNEFVRSGADVLIELTNDGYLGNTPVLRQHLANAVFRAVETNRPVLRVTNVGITAYINERGEVMDAADVYTEATRVWTISESNGGQTFYVRFGDWFAWFCSLVSLLVLFCSFRRRGISEEKL